MSAADHESMGLLSAEFSIRPMSVLDIDRVIEVAKESPGAPHWTASAYVAAVDSEPQPARIALVAEDAASGALAGFLVASVIAPEATLESVVVAPKHRRRGLGVRLMRALMERLPALGVTDLMLEVRASNQAAIGLYAGLEFVQTGKRARYYADPEEDAILMNLHLSP